MYTVRDYLKTPKDIAGSLRKIKNIGYGAVELVELSQITAAELKTMLDGIGLVACSAHVSSENLFGNIDEVIERLSILGAKSAAYPYPAGIDFSTIAGVKSLAKKLDKAGAALKEAGIVLTYHNHNIEFVKIKGQTVLSHIYELTDPLQLQGEIDTYWVQSGGGDSVAWIKSLKKRMPLLHMKDYGVDLDKTPQYEEIGSGNLDWAPIVKAAKASGCKWYIVEQDAYWEKNDPFKSLKTSFTYITENLCVD